MTAPLRVAVMGAGYFSRFHLESWRSLPGAELVGICEPDPERLSQALGEPRGAVGFDDAATMLAALQPDIVDIVTPPPTHLELVRLACRAAPRVVICQKALAPTPAEALAVVEVAEAARVPLVVHENFRFAPWYREARRLLRAGLLGDPYSVSFRLRPGDGQGRAAYLDRQPYFRTMPRLLVYETAIHFIDTFRFLLGEVEAVTARLRRINPDIAGEDAGYVIFEFAGGTTGLFDGNRLSGHPADDLRRTMGEMWLEGSGGTLRLDGQARLWFTPHGGTEREHGYDRGPAGAFAGGAVAALQSHVLAFARGGSPAENTGREYLRNIDIQEAIYRSHREGRRIGLEPTPDRAPAQTPRGDIR
ncbi:MAG: gfo/Idh/MocA family oxidoreductase [Burkholderiales bacterium]|nr:MAG: gfo/Idh/MocA family oxidoreductase [Burkholderiales bacterium]